MRLPILFQKIQKFSFFKSASIKGMKWYLIGKQFKEDRSEEIDPYINIDSKRVVLDYVNINHASKNRQL